MEFNFSYEERVFLKMSERAFHYALAIVEDRIEDADDVAGLSSEALCKPVDWEELKTCTAVEPAELLSLLKFDETISLEILLLGIRKRISEDLPRHATAFLRTALDFREDMVASRRTQLQQDGGWTETKSGALIRGSGSAFEKYRRSQKK